ncbi:hypothetical protein N665_0544s0017 [Sinapis alba]|nr:hypothetical protein N665_0544s0017 [Sinapis alba]KAF8088369.1 hypothetical protein N665_0544s0017 [Sinapis alba]KAF8088370.1 hypothetical protein N665_0544s0017 [Sinapis alba]
MKVIIKVFLTPISQLLFSKNMLGQYLHSHLTKFTACVFFSWVSWCSRVPTWVSWYLSSV